ncbi:MAG: hypothetical protein ABL973_09670 [Micropepsaceae bacterium]
MPHYDKLVVPALRPQRYDRDVLKLSQRKIGYRQKRHALGIQQFLRNVSHNGGLDDCSL